MSSIRLSATLLRSSLLSLAALLFAGPALAADNSGIVIIDQQHQATPFGSYDSQRRTQVYGPSSGFRYEEYRTPVQPVYPRYRNGYRRDYRGGYAYGPGDRGRHQNGRVIEHYGPNGYGRYGAPAAPRIDRYGRGNVYGRGHDNSADHSGRGRHDYSDGYRGRRDNGRAIEPAQRAIEPARRAMGRDHR